MWEVKIGKIHCKQLSNRFKAPVYMCNHQAKWPNLGLHNKDRESQILTQHQKNRIFSVTSLMLNKNESIQLAKRLRQNTHIIRLKPQ